jgi:heterodisulfide reductase subunit C
MDIKNIEFDDYDPTNNSLKPNVEQTESVKKVTSFDKMESEKNSLLRI